MVCGGLLIVGCSTPGPSPWPEADRAAEDRPASFVDYVPRRDGKPVAFEMVLILGDGKRNIKPFYIARTEVTWAMFEDWMYGFDLEDMNEWGELQSEGLRPSPLGHGHPQIELNMLNYEQLPAIGMSWRTAQAFCRWLSEKTGRDYRLPTDREWQYLLAQSGGVPADVDQLLEQGTFASNAIEEHELYQGKGGVPPFDPFADEDDALFKYPTPVGLREPDELGLYDLLGNAAEWVQPMGDKAWVRGGHFMMGADEVTPGWRTVEDQQVWNASYPGRPISTSWYINHFYQGIRLVCAIPVPYDEVGPRGSGK
jgi:hypothetical protein